MDPADSPEFEKHAIALSVAFAKMVNWLDSSLGYMITKQSVMEVATRMLAQFASQITSEPDDDDHPTIVVDIARGLSVGKDVDFARIQRLAAASGKNVAEVFSDALERGLLSLENDTDLSN